MINLILTSFINLIIILCNIILAPVNALIESTLPEISDMLRLVPDLFDKATVYLNWVVSLSGLSTVAIQFIILYFTFKLTAPLTVYVIKFVIKWYNTLKP